MRKRLLMSAAGAALLAATGCTTTTSGPAREDPLARRRSIDAAVDAGLSRLYAQVPESRELVAKASGTLVFPEVITAGFVVGASYGEGALRRRARTVAYYRLVSAAAGLLAGAQSRALHLLFMTQDALARFESSNGWTAGADASVAVATLGANGAIDIRALQAPVVGFVLTNAGLMADLSLEGTKISRVDL
jgi:lipid-binding SYLF domain-containing protein